MLTLSGYRPEDGVQSSRHGVGPSVRAAFGRVATSDCRHYDFMHCNLTTRIPVGLCHATAYSISNCAALSTNTIGNHNVWAWPLLMGNIASWSAREGAPHFRLLVRRERIVSMAAYFGIINVTTRTQHAHQNNLANFRSWLYSHLSSDGRVLRSSSTFYGIFGQAEQFSGYPMRYIGCQSNLDHNLLEVLDLLGYDTARLRSNRRKLLPTRCKAQCNGQRRTTWFDQTLELAVMRWFLADFYHFNFSTAARDMYEPCRLDPWRLQALAGQGQLRVGSARPDDRRERERERISRRMPRAVSF